MININNSSTSAWSAAAVLLQAIQENSQEMSAQAAQQAEDAAVLLDEEPSEVLQLSPNALKNPWDEMFSEDKRAQNAALNKNEGPPDESHRLTRMLVAARTQIEVQSVISEVYKHMQGWQMAAANGDEKAIAVIRRLNKLISRGNRKVRDLGKEQDMRERQKRAEKAKQEHLERKIKDELKRAERERKQREQGYLHERDTYQSSGPVLLQPSKSAIEAKMMALAEAMAALSSFPGSMESSSVESEVSGEVGGGESAAVESEEAPVE